MKPTLSIGIAAYNEEANIGQLLTALLEQRISLADPREIVVVSDASTDGTDRIVSGFGTKVRLFRHERRLGATDAQNTLLSNVSGDILLMLDADIIPRGHDFIDKIIRNMIEAKADLGSAAIIPVAGETRIEKVLAWSHLEKVRLFEGLSKNSGVNTVYLCFGPVRAFSKKLYSVMRYPKDCPPDAYSYLFAKEKGFKFIYIKEAEALFRMPTTFIDYRKQSVRYVGGNSRLAELFGAGFVTAEFTIPRSRLVTFLMRTSLRHPVFSLRYAILRERVWFGGSTKKFRSDWEQATTSKKLNTRPSNLQ